LESNDVWEVDADRYEERLSQEPALGAASQKRNSLSSATPSAHFIHHTSKKGGPRDRLCHFQTPVVAQI
jgi:hypothetical protein